MDDLTTHMSSTSTTYPRTHVNEPALCLRSRTLRQASSHAAAAVLSPPSHRRAPRPLLLPPLMTPQLLPPSLLCATATTHCRATVRTGCCCRCRHCCIAAETRGAVAEPLYTSRNLCWSVHAAAPEPLRHELLQMNVYTRAVAHEQLPASRFA